MLDGIQIIGNSAFWGCQDLKSLNIPGSVTALGTSVCRDCENLSEVELSDLFQEIPEEIFWCCKSLTGITIPGRIRKIGKDAFFCQWFSTS
jgi:hypothetical protein